MQSRELLASLALRAPSRVGDGPLLCWILVCPAALVRRSAIGDVGPRSERTGAHRQRLRLRHGVSSRTRCNGDGVVPRNRQHPEGDRCRRGSRRGRPPRRDWPATPGPANIIERSVESASVAELALARQDSFRKVIWRQGSKGPISSRFAVWRVRHAHRTSAGAEPLAACWLIAEWPIGADAPAKFFFANLPESTSKQYLVRLVKNRWGVEHSYKELKDELSTISKDAPGEDGIITSRSRCRHMRFSSNSAEKSGFRVDLAQTSPTPSFVPLILALPLPHLRPTNQAPTIKNRLELR